MVTTYNKRVVNIKPTSIALLQGVFMAVLGLGVAIMASLNTTVSIAQSTDSVLAGLTLGIARGAIAILIVPFVYFGIGWVIGFFQGFILNFLIEASGGIEVKLEDNK